MKYWLLTTEYPPQYGGGIATYCLHTATMLAEAGHEVTVFIAGGPTRKSDHEQKDTIRLVYISESDGGKVNLGYEAKLSYATSLVIGEYLKKEGAPDWLEFQDYMGIGYYTLQKCKLGYPLFVELKTIITLHAPLFLYLKYNKVPLYQFPNYWIGEMEKWCIKAADIRISPSQFLIDTLKTYPELSEEEYIHLPNPYEVKEELVSAKFQKNLYTFFGKMTPQKGIFAVLPLLKKLWDSGSPLQFKIIGGGDHLYHLTGKIAQTELENKYKSYFSKGQIEVTGNLPPNELRAALSDAEAVVFPSTVDNLPYAVMEAMALGKICLVSKSGGQAELVEDGVTGFIFDYGTNDFAAKINQIDSLNTEERTVMGQKARKFILDHFSKSAILNKKTNLLETHQPLAQEGALFPFNRLKSKTKQLTDQSISIVIPFYNLSLYLEDTLKSIHSALQHLSEDVRAEVLLVDDGSTPEESKAAEALCKKYGANYHHQANQGLCSTRNNGAKLAKGRYLFFLDADDTIDPEYLTSALTVLSTYDNVHFVGCWAQYFGISDNIWPAFQPEPPYALIHNPINSSALVFERNCFLEVGGNDPEMDLGMEDYETVVKLIGYNFGGVVLPDTYWNYRIRKDSMVGNFTKTAELLLYTKIADKNKELFQEHGVEISHLLNANGPGINYDNPTRKVLQIRPMDISIFNSRLSSKYLGNGPHVKIIRKIGARILKPWM